MLLGRSWHLGTVVIDVEIRKCVDDCRCTYLHVLHIFIHIYIYTIITYIYIIYIYIYI